MSNNNIKDEILSGLDDLISKSKNHQFELEKILTSSSQLQNEIRGKVNELSDKKGEIEQLKQELLKLRTAGASEDDAKQTLEKLVKENTELEREKKELEAQLEKITEASNNILDAVKQTKIQNDAELKIILDKVKSTANENQKTTDAIKSVSKSLNLVDGYRKRSRHHAIKKSAKRSIKRRRSNKRSVRRRRSNKRSIRRRRSNKRSVKRRRSNKRSVKRK